MQLKIVLLTEKKVLSDVAGVQECGVLCNIHREQCNTLIYNEDSRNCHLIEVDIGIWLDYCYNNHLINIQIDCKIILSAEDTTVAYMRSDMLQR